MSKRRALCTSRSRPQISQNESFYYVFYRCCMTSYFGCYMDVIKRRCQDIIIEHPKDIIQGAGMYVFMMSFLDVG